MPYFWGYLIPACSLILATIIFIVGRQSYILRPPAGSELATMLSIVKEAAKKSWKPSLSSLFIDHWLERAKHCYGGSYSNWEVEDVKKVFRLFPIFGMSILYFTVLSQVSVIDIVLPSRKPSCHHLSLLSFSPCFLHPLFSILFLPLTLLSSLPYIHSLSTTQSLLIFSISSTIPLSYPLLPASLPLSF